MPIESIVAALAARLTSPHSVAALLALAGILCLLLAILGWLPGLVAKGKAPRILLSILGLVLLLPAYRVAMQGEPDPEVTLRTKVTQQTVDTTPKPISRGIPFRIEKKWFVLGGTTISTTPQTGGFYVLPSESRDVDPIGYEYERGKGKSFEVDEVAYCFKATEIYDAWVQASVYPASRDQCEGA